MARRTSHTLRARIAADDGTSALEFALLAPMVLAIFGVAIMTGWAFINLALLDRAAEIVAREISIDGDQARAIAEAQASTPLVELSAIEVRDGETGAPLTDTPTAGQSYEVVAEVQLTNPIAPLIRAFPFSPDVPDTLSLQRTSRGLGQ